jgi:N-acetylglucosamine kinase-like BadF-type ATPase
MTAVLQAYDGRIRETMLAKSVLKHFGFADVLDMVFQVSHGLVRTTGDDQIGLVPDSGSGNPGADEASVGGLFFRRRTRNEPLTRCEVATLCPVVVEVAQLGDWKATEILRDAGRELGRLGAAIIKRLDMGQEEFSVVPFGGVFRAGELVLGAFRDTVLAVAPSAAVVKPRFEPVVGAVLLALNELGVDIGDPIMEAVEHSSTRFPACQAH